MTVIKFDILSKMRFYQIILTAFLFYTGLVQAQPWEEGPPIAWTHLYIQDEILDGDENAGGIFETPDGNYMILGFAAKGTDLGNYDYMMLLFNPKDSIIFDKRFGTDNVENFKCGLQTDDGNYLLGGVVNYNELQIDTSETGVIDTTLLDHSDTWIMKASAEGDSLWSVIVGGKGNDEIWDLVSLKDGTYIMSGYSTSEDGDYAGNQGRKDLWLMKFDDEGTVLWKKLYGYEWNEIGSNIAYDQTNELLYVCGSTSSIGNGKNDVWLIKTDMEGTILEEKTYGGSEGDSGLFISLLSNGNLVISGTTQSIDGDVPEGFGPGGDVWVFALDENLEIDWTTVYGDINHDLPHAQLEGADGFIYVAGAAFKNPVKRAYDAFAIKLDRNTGEIIWEGIYGAPNYDFVYCMTVNNNGELVLAGGTDSMEGDVTGNGKTTIQHGAHNVWIFSLSMLTGIEDNLKENNTFFHLYPNPLNSQKDLLHIQLNKPDYSGVCNIYNILGQIIFSIPIEQTGELNIPLSPYQDGILFVEVCMDGECYRQKVLVF